MATTKKPVIPQPTLRRAAQTKKPATNQVDLSALLNLPAQVEAGFQRVIDVLSNPVPTNSAPPLQTAAENAAERLEALLIIFSGRQAQNILQDMLESGRAPSREQLLREADKLIAARGGK